MLSNRQLAEGGSSQLSVRIDYFFEQCLGNISFDSVAGATLFVAILFATCVLRI